MDFTRTLVCHGIDATLQKYSGLRKKLSAKAIMREYAMNNIGYVFMQKKQYQNAIKIFQLNVASYPGSSNVYDSLGEAYMANGGKELAIKNYDKLLKLNPDNENGAEKLKQLLEK